MRSTEPNAKGAAPGRTGSVRSTRPGHPRPCPAPTGSTRPGHIHQARCLPCSHFPKPLWGASRGSRHPPHPTHTQQGRPESAAAFPAMSPEHRRPAPLDRGGAQKTALATEGGRGQDPAGRDTDPRRCGHPRHGCPAASHAVPGGRATPTTPTLRPGKRGAKPGSSPRKGGGGGGLPLSLPPAPRGLPSPTPASPERQREKSGGETTPTRPTSGDAKDSERLGTSGERNSGTNYRQNRNGLGGAD